MIKTLTTVAIVLAGLSDSAHAQNPPTGATGIRMEGRRITNIRRGDVNEFIPAVAAVDSGGHCTEPLRIGLASDQRIMSYAFEIDGKRVRVVNVVVDSLNQMFRYTDSRGQLTRTRAEIDAGITTPTTFIQLNSNPPFALLRNEGEGQAAGPLQVPTSAALNAANLGYPGKMIADVIQRCAAFAR